MIFVTAQRLDPPFPFWIYLGLGLDLGLVNLSPCHASITCIVRHLVDNTLTALILTNKLGQILETAVNMNLNVFVVHYISINMFHRLCFFTEQIFPKDSGQHI